MSKNETITCPTGFVMGPDGVCIPENTRVDLNIPKAASPEEVQKELDDTPLSTKLTALGKVMEVFKGLNIKGVFDSVVDTNVEGLKRTGSAAIAAGIANLVLNGVYSISDEDSDVGKFLRRPSVTTVLYGLTTQGIVLSCNLLEPKFPNLRYIAVAASQNGFEHVATTLALAEKLRGLSPVLDFFLTPAPDVPKM